jgi:hypothetical protein
MTDHGNKMHFLSLFVVFWDRLSSNYGGSAGEIADGQQHW